MVLLADTALRILREKSVYGKPLENHCIRLAEFSIALGRKRGVEVDEDLLFCGCYLHDIGLCITDPCEPNYLKRGQKFASKITEDWNLDANQKKVLDDVMLFSHSIRQVPRISPQGELVRLAVRTEHSVGFIRNGLSKSLIRDVLKRYPRQGFSRVLLSFFRIAIIDDSPKELVRIFFP